MTASPLSKIEKSILIRAPRSRVWQAITSIADFSKWFGVQAEGSFTPGARVRMVSTVEGYKGIEFYVTIVEVVPEETFSWRWHPGVPEGGIDYSKEPMTLVTFRLDDVEGGTVVTIEESGFDKISLARRERLYRENEGGWKHQLASLDKYVGRPL